MMQALHIMEAAIFVFLAATSRQRHPGIEDVDHIGFLLQVASAGCFLTQYMPLVWTTG
jgi:hypothetical protein